MAFAARRALLALPNQLIIFSFIDVHDHFLLIIFLCFEIGETLAVTEGQTKFTTQGRHRVNDVVTIDASLARHADFLNIFKWVAASQS